MFTQGLHHAAYRCSDAQRTVDFYTRVLGLDYTMAISEDRVPSTKEPDPYMHIFFDLGDGSCLAFFELPNSKPAQKDPNTPAWVQHIALRVESLERLLAARQHVESCGVEVLGPTDHGLFQSIYFFDPDGHRLELAANTAPKALWEKAAAQASTMLAEWNKSKRTVRQTAWLHDKEFRKV